MPCWQRASNVVTLEKMTGDRLALFKTALESLGYGVYSAEHSRRSYGCELAANNFRTGTSIKVDASGKVTFIDSKAGRPAAESAAIQNQLKRAYAGEVVKAAAKRFNWSLSQTSENQFLAQKRF